MSKRVAISPGEAADRLAIRELVDVLRNQARGRIVFANTDLAGASDHLNSIREADRAVQQVIGASAAQ